MALLINAGRAASPVRPIVPAGHPELDVLPYVPGRLVFADLAVRAMAGRTYDRVLVDLPAFLSTGRWLRNPLSLLPQVSLAIFALPGEHYRYLAFSPADAACAVLAVARHHAIPARCVDDADRLRYPRGTLFRPRVKLPEDYRARLLGVRRYFAPAWSEIAKCWSQLDEEQRFFARYRARVIARHICAASAQGGRSLLVCEYRLWWLVRRALESGEAPGARYLFQWDRYTRGALLIDEPGAAWSRGLLDDYPAVTHAFWEALRALPDLRPAATAHDPAPRVLAFPGGGGGDLAAARRQKPRCGFDKLGALDRILRAALGGGAGAHPSTRETLQFLRYLRRLALARGRIIPCAGRHVLHAAAACGGRRLHQAVAGALLRYPTLDNPARQAFVLGRDGRIRNCITLPSLPGLDALFDHAGCTRGEDLDLDDAEREARWFARAALAPDLPPLELPGRDEVDQFLGIRYTTPPDYRLYAHATEMLRVQRARIRNRTHTVRSWSRLEAGIDLKATLRARACGDPALYVRRRTTGHAPCAGEDAGPVVFVFASDEAIEASSSFCVHDPNLAQRRREYGDEDFPYARHPPADQVYSLFASYDGSRSIVGGHLQRMHLTALALLVTRPLMGIERYTAISRLPAARQCRDDPIHDPRFADTTTLERIIAWTIEYADRQVLICAPAGWTPPVGATARAARRGVRLELSTLDSLPPALRDRMRRLYFMSGEIKRSPCRDELLEKLLDGIE